MPRSLQALDDAAIVARVLAWFDVAARDLPWRDPECSAWGVLVSEVMLQQTPVARVEPVWHEWMKRWPTASALAAASQADAVRAWGRLGYPRRAQRLFQCAREIVERHGGDVPRGLDALRALPGVGEYTAAAVAAFAYGERTVVLDTNIRRVIGRGWHAQPLPPAHLTRAEREHAATLVPANARDAVAWNAAAMELGALVCQARTPRCEVCPIVGDCQWRAAGNPGLDEAPRRTQAWHGTDRQVRGAVMAVLRAASAPLNVTGHHELRDVEPGQLDRCLESLVADELIMVADAAQGTYSL